MSQEDGEVRGVLRLRGLSGYLPGAEADDEDEPRSDGHLSGKPGLGFGSAL